MSDTIAIDFGTSRTKVAYFDPRTRQPQLMRQGDDLPFAPSLFYLERDSDRILWGCDAEKMLEEDPAGVIEVLKRHLQDRFVYGNRRKAAPKDLLVLLFSGLRRQAGSEVAAFRGVPPRNAVLTVPSLYGTAVEKLLQEAAAVAGFESVDLIPEPVAAAHAWLAETGAAGEDVVVLDCGGGTLDWAYLRYRDNVFNFVPECPPDGDLHVGGFDVDLDLLHLVMEKLPECEEEIEARQPFYLRRIRMIKERYCQGLPPRPLDVDRHKIMFADDEIQAVLRDRFITQACDNLEAFTGKVKAVADGRAPTILLVGGSARITGLREAVEARCGCKALWWERSEYATVLGALAQASPVTKPLAPSSVPSMLMLTLAGHEDDITSLSFLENGTTIASAGRDNIVRFRVAATGAELGIRRLDEQTERSACLSPAGDKLAIENRDGSISLWAIPAGRRMQTLGGHAGRIYAMTFSADGEWLATRGGDNKITVWSSSSKAEPLTFDYSGMFGPMAVSPGGCFVALDGDCGQAVILDARSGARYRSFGQHQSAISQLAFSPNGSTLAYADDCTIRLWEIESGREWLSLHAGPVSSLAFSADGRLLAAGRYRANTTTVWDVATGNEQATLSGSAAVFSPDGTQAATCSRHEAINAVNARTGEVASTFAELGGGAGCIAIPRSGGMLAIGEDNAVRIWDTGSGQELWKFHGHAEVLTCIALSHDGSLLASCARDCAVKLWHLATKREWRLIPQESVVISAVFSTDTRILLATNVNGEVAAFDVSSGRRLYALDPTSVTLPRMVAASPNGCHAAIVDSDGVLHWDIETGNNPRRLHWDGQAEALAFSHEGGFLAVTGMRDTGVFDMRSGKLVRRFPHEDSFDLLSFGANDKYLAMSSGRATIVWEIDTSREVQKLHRLAHAVFSPDGRTLFGSHAIHTVRLWR